MTNNQIDMVCPDKFKLGKKWFWIGIIISIFNIVGGLVYGIVLLLEKNHRKEGIIIIAWAIIWTLFSFFVIGPYLVKSGLLPQFQIAQPAPSIQQVELPQQISQ